MTRTMSGKVVLITGAARGIGAGVARRLAGQGAKLALVGLEGDELRAVGRRVRPGRLRLGGRRHRLGGSASRGGTGSRRGTGGSTW